MLKEKDRTEIVEMDLTGRYFCSFSVKGQPFNEEFKVVLEATVSVYDKNGILKKRMSSKLSSKQVLIKHIMQENLEKGLDLSKVMFDKQIDSYCDEISLFGRTGLFGSTDKTSCTAGERNLVSNNHDPTSSTDSNRTDLQITQKLRLDCFWVHIPENELKISNKSEGKPPVAEVQLHRSDSLPESHGISQRIKIEPFETDHGQHDIKSSNNLEEIPSDKLQHLLKKEAVESNLTQDSHFQNNHDNSTNLNDLTIPWVQNHLQIESNQSEYEESLSQKSKQIVTNHPMKEATSEQNEVIPTALILESHSNILSGCNGNKFDREEVPVSFIDKHLNSLNSYSDDYQEKQLLKLENLIDEQIKTVSSLNDSNTSQLINASVDNQIDSVGGLQSMLITATAQSLVEESCNYPEKVFVICNESEDDDESVPLSKCTEEPQTSQVNLVDNASAVVLPQKFLSQSEQTVSDVSARNQVSVTEIQCTQEKNQADSANQTSKRKNRGVVSETEAKIFHIKNAFHEKVDQNYLSRHKSISLDHTYKKNYLKQKKKAKRPFNIKRRDQPFTLNIARKNRKLDCYVELEKMVDDNSEEDHQFTFSENKENDFELKESEKVEEKILQTSEIIQDNEAEVRHLNYSEGTEAYTHTDDHDQLKNNSSNGKISRDFNTMDTLSSTTESNISGRNCPRKCRKNISYQKMESFYDNIDIPDDDSLSDTSKGSEKQVKPDSDYEPSELSSDMSDLDEDHESPFSGEENELIEERLQQIKKQKVAKHTNIQIDLSEHEDKYEIIKVISHEQRDRGKPVDEISHSSFACLVCACQFQTKDEESFKVHIGLHLQGKLRCCVCELEFASDYDKRNHIKTEHPEKRSKKISIVCEICGIEFMKKPWRNHMYKVHNISKYECRFCDKESERKFPSQKELHEHEKNEHADQLFSCNKCERQFSTRWAYMKHRVKCEGKAPDELGQSTCVCHLCGSTYQKQECLKRHIRISHQKEKKFKCELCPYAAFIKYKLTRHMAAAHLGELKLSTLGKNFSRQHIEIFFLFFPENRI